MNESAHNVIPLAPKPAPSYISVNPDIAQRWLRGNVVNRSLRAAKVQQYAADMAAGRWNFSESAICFSPDGQLLNGQHRLHAIVASGTSVVLLVIRNMPADAMVTMDIGSARTAADALKFVGEAHQALLAATLKLCLLVDTKRIYRDTRLQAVSPGELIDFLAVNPEVRASVASAASNRKGIDCTPSAMACAHWLIANAAGRGMADHYFGQLSSRSNEPDGSAVLAVDSRLREIRRLKATHSQREYVYLLVKGWNHYAKGNSVRSLPIRPKGEFRIPAAVRSQR